MSTNIFALASSSSPPPHTPVKRRESTINTRQFHADQEQEWTTARCNRLLRALTSRVALLKKDLLRCAQSKKVASSNNAQTRFGSSISGDASWTQAKKRIRKTYSARGGKSTHGRKASKGRQSLNPGELSIPTPLLTRVGSHDAHDNAPVVPFPPVDLLNVNTTRRRGARKPLGIGEGKFQLTKSLREIRQDVTTVRYTNYEGIYNGLESLLRATEQENVETRRRGARSLVSMSLRAIPSYIKQQEGLLDAHMEETGSRSALQNRDIATEIYDELEEFGTSGHGWHQLRAVVKAHGIQVLVEAIQVGLFDNDFCGALITLCTHTSSLDEAQQLLSALISATHHSTPKTIYDQLSQPIAMLCKFAQHTGRTSFQYRQLASVVSSGLLPVEWLATREFGSIWTEAIQWSVPGSDNGDILKFLDIALSALLHSGAGATYTLVPSNGMGAAIGNTFSSVLTTLLSIVMLSRTLNVHNDTELQETSVKRHQYFAQLLKNCAVGCHNERTVSTSCSILPLVVNLVLDHEDFDSLAAGIASSDTLLAALEKSDSEAVTFVCQVARCCGRGASNSGFGFLNHLHQILESLLDDRKGNRALMVLIVDSAFTFARKVPDRKHLDYAASMDSKFCSRELGSESSLHSISVNDGDDEDSSFRWEEGIGEWVTATPAALKPKRKHISDEVSSEKECDSPYRPPPYLRNLSPEPRLTPLGDSQGRYEHGVEIHVDHQMDDLLEDIHDRGLDQDSFSAEQSIGNASPISDSADELGETSPHYTDSPSSDESDDVETDDEIELSFTEESLVSGNSPSILNSVSASNHRSSIHRAPRLNRRLTNGADHWQVFDESFNSTTSSQVSTNSSGSSGPRRGYIDRAPRLGRKALQSEAWKLFDDESDDELSFLSVSSQEASLLRDVTSTSIANTRCTRQAKPTLTQSKSRKNSKQIMTSFSDSEDELCI